MGLNAAAYTVLNLPLRLSILHLEVWSLCDIYMFKWLLFLTGCKERCYTKLVLPRQSERQGRIWVRKWRHILDSCVLISVCHSVPETVPPRSCDVLQQPPGGMYE